jgi:hypothetical protein
MTSSRVVSVEAPNGGVCDFHGGVTASAPPDPCHGQRKNVHGIGPEATGWVTNSPMTSKDATHDCGSVGGEEQSTPQNETGDVYGMEEEEEGRRRRVRGRKLFNLRKKEGSHSKLHQDNLMEGHGTRRKKKWKVAAGYSQIRSIAVIHQRPVAFFLPAPVLEPR